MRARRQRRTAAWFTTAVCAAVLSVGVHSGAQSADELAKKHFDSGTAYLQESDYANALKAFQKSLELSHRPVILLNIATVHERIGSRASLTAAVEALNQYLEKEPKGDHVATVHARIANLQKRIDALPPEPPPDTSDAGAHDAEPEAAAPPPTATATTTIKPPDPPPPAPEPVADDGPNIPAYVLIGLGSLAAGGAIVTGLLAQSEHSDAKDTCSPSCTDDQISSGKTMALTSTILTGVAVLGVGIGAALLLTGGSESPPPQASLKPRMWVGLGPSGFSADAQWRF